MSRMGDDPNKGPKRGAQGQHLSKGYGFMKQKNCELRSLLVHGQLLRHFGVLHGGRVVVVNGIRNLAFIAFRVEGGGGGGGIESEVICNPCKPKKIWAKQTYNRFGKPKVPLTGPNKHC